MVRFSSPAPSWKINLSKVMSQVEIDTVLSDLTEKSRQNPQAFVKLVIFRLAVFSGVRASELAGLRMEDVALDSDLPVIRVRAETAKGHHSREIPLFSEETRSDLLHWKMLRTSQGATASDPFVCSVSKSSQGHSFTRQSIRNRFRSAVKCLGKERAGSLSVHHGRHTFASMSLHKLVPISLVRDSLGHSSLSITNLYVGLFRDRKGLTYSLDS
jgi:integrase